jgi:DNA-binding CsgD family transcriptional regulator/tetratricopeptide (TPR) repeat protein
LASLVDNNLLQKAPAGADGDARFRMLETIREYGLERLNAAGEAAAARQAHAAYYQRLVAEAEGRLRGSEQVVWLNRLEAEHDNLRAALDWLQERGEIGPALAMAGGLWFFWWVRGYFSEGRSQLERLLSRPDARGRTSERAKALNATAILICSLGASERAVALHEEALTIYRELGDRAGAAWVLVSLHHALMGLGNLERSIAATEESLALFQELGDAWGEARAQTVLGVLALDGGDWTRAMRLLKKGRGLAEALGDRWIAGMALRNLVFIAMEWPSSDETAFRQEAALLEEGLQHVRALGENRALPYYLLDLGAVQAREGNLEASTALFEEAVTVARQTGAKELVAVSLNSLGRNAQCRGDRRRAAHLFGESIELAVELGNKREIGAYLESLAFLAGTPGRSGADRAARLLGAADRLLVESGVARTGAEQHDLEQETARIRAALGATAFKDAWDAGAAMPLETTIAVAAALESYILREPATSDAEIPAREQHGLSPRELEVLRLMADGRSNQQIADQLFLSFRTVTTYVTNILTKLGVESRTGAVAYAIRAGIA